MTFFSEESDDPSTLEILKENIREGAKYMGVGFLGLVKAGANLVVAGANLVVGTAEIVDSTAIGLGATAILAVGGTVVAPVWAIASRDRNIIDTEIIIGQVANDPRMCRIFGYPLLAVAGGYIGSQFIK